MINEWDAIKRRLDSFQSVYDPVKFGYNNYCITVSKQLVKNKIVLELCINDLVYGSDEVQLQELKKVFKKPYYRSSHGLISYFKQIEGLTLQE